MEIHKPKPVHNWREFLIEIGVVVIGVCIALAAEQAVEWVHWHNEVAAARKAINAEMAIIDTFYAGRLAAAPCIDQKLDRVAGMISDIAAGRQPLPVVTTFNGLGSLLSDSEWRSEQSSQVLTHFPREELALMSRYYAQVAGMVGWESQEADAWAQLAVLLDAAQNLGPNDLALLRLNYHLARRFEYVIPLNGKRQLAISDALGIKYPATTSARLEGRCNSFGGQSKF